MFKKRSLLTIALLVTILSLSACKKDVANNGVGKEDNIVTEENNSATQDNSATEDNSAIEEEGNSVDEDNLTEENNSIEESDSKSSQDLSDIVKQIYEIKPSGLRTMELPLDLANADAVSYNTGLKDASKIKEAIVSEAMITSQAYSLVLVRVNDQNDTEAVAQEMLEGINPAKWICVSGDDLLIAAVDDLILLIMVSPQLSDTVTSQKIVDAFGQVIGQDFDLTLTK